MNPNLEILSFFDPAIHTASDLVIDKATKKAAIIDPALDSDQSSGKASVASVDRMLEVAKAESAQIDWVLENPMSMTGSAKMNSSPNAKRATRRSLRRPCCCPRLRPI